MEARKTNIAALSTLVVILLVIMACSSAYRAVPDEAGPRGSIVYSSNENGNFEIYQMNINSYATVRLTNNTSEDISPFYFSAGRFGFVSDKSGKYAIYTIGFDGVDQEVWKTDDQQGYLAPSLSVDGTKVAYVVQYNTSNSSIYWSNVDGGKENILTQSTGSEWDPDWSPDGKSVVFSSDEGGDWEIDLVTLADGKITKLTDNKDYDGHPQWSPDGESILFESDRDGDWEIYLMDVDGGNVRQITENGSADWAPSWSPDGNWILYVSNSDGDDEISIVGTDGLNQKRLTNNTVQDRFPFWIA